MFGENIYLLVNSNVYSASEGFAMFCKATGFATLVGSNTGGDGGMLTIRQFDLANTGLLISFSTTFSLNPDGSSNTEFGSIPDVYIGENQTELEACLALIE
jgi:C-terminal processing protease CtpA/Prc